MIWRVRRYIAIAALVVVAWLGFGAWAGPLSGQLSEVSKNDNASFLPADAEATKAQQLAARFTDRATTPAVVVYERTAAITPADTQRIADDARDFATVEGSSRPLPPPVPSADGRAVQIIVPIDSTGTGGESGDVDAVVERLRERGAERGRSDRARDRPGRAAGRPDRRVPHDRRAAAARHGGRGGRDPADRVPQPDPVAHPDRERRHRVRRGRRGRLLPGPRGAWSTSTGSPRASSPCWSSGRAPTTRCCSSRATGRNCIATPARWRRCGSRCAGPPRPSWPRPARSSRACSACCCRG